MNCKQCNNEFQEVNSIQKFCSLKCKNAHNNKIYQAYSNQKDKGIIRKLELIAMKCAVIVKIIQHYAFII